MATSITNTSISTDTINVDNGVLYVDNNNNRVGVGTSSPTTALNVESSSYPYVRVTNTGYTGLDIGQADASEGGAALIKLRDAADMDFYTADLNRMRISSTGNVGIGKVTTDPDAKLDVLGDVKIQDGNSFFDSSDEFGYARFTHNYGNAQIGLFRTGNSIGGMYIGGNDSQFAILNQNRAQRWSVTQDGVVNAPYQPSASVKLNSDNSQGGQNQTVGPSGTLATNIATIKFETTVSNTGGHYSTSTGRFTCPVDGKYFVTFNSNINMGSATGNTYPEIHLNNVLYIRAYDSDDYNQGSWAQQSITAIIPCSAGDYLEIKLRCSSGYAWADSDTQYTQASFMLL